MNVLIACEESQRVCLEFRKRGHNAYSADIQEPSGGFPDYHILGDIIPYLVESGNETDLRSYAIKKSCIRRAYL